MQLKFTVWGFFNTCPIFGVRLTFPMSLHVLKTAVSSLPYGKCGLGCDQAISTLMSSLWGAWCWWLGLLLPQFLGSLGFLSCVSISQHAFLTPGLPAAAPYPERAMVCLAVTWGQLWHPPQRDHSPTCSWSRGGSSHWVRHRCYNKANPDQAKPSSDTAWDTAVPGQYRACVLLLLMAQITFTGVQ